MRKVKVVAALLCALTPGVLGSYRIDGAYSVKVSGQHLNDLVLMAEPATAAASIETTIVTSTTKPVTTSAADTTTTTEEETTTTATENLETEITTTETEMTEKTVRTEPPAPLVAASPVTTSKKAAKTKVTTTTTTVQTTTTAKTTSEYSADSTVDAEQTATKTEAETKSALPITEAEYIMLCNVVGHEYGADWISEYDKALVVEVVMNRVKSPKFPNTIYGVLTQKNQFTGMKKYINLGTFSRQVTKSVKAAVDLYFAEPERFNHGYLFFEGDGKRNYFRIRY